MSLLPADLNAYHQLRLESTVSTHIIPNAWPYDRNRLIGMWYGLELCQATSMSPGRAGLRNCADMADNDIKFYNTLYIICKYNTT